MNVGEVSPASLLTTKGMTMKKHILAVAVVACFLSGCASIFTEQAYPNDPVPSAKPGMPQYSVAVAQVRVTTQSRVTLISAPVTAAIYDAQTSAYLAIAAKADHASAPGKTPQ